MVDMEMDCSSAEQGWFEFKSYISDWEMDVEQTACTGSLGGSAPYTTSNHMGMCGAINVFEYGLGSCEINSFDE